MNRPQGRSHVVLLRSARDDDPYEAAFREAGYSVCCQPVLAFAQVNEQALAQRLNRAAHYAGLVVTSPRAVGALEEALDAKSGQGAAWQDKPAFAVGPRTAEALAALGFAPQGQESGSAQELAAFIARQTFKEPLLFLCGNRRRDVLPNRLREAGIPFEEQRVYETHLRTDLDLTTPAVPDWLVFFSPSGIKAVRQAGAMQDAQLAAVRLAAIGPTTAQALREAGWGAAAVAGRPATDALVEAIREHGETGASPPPGRPPW